MVRAMDGGRSRCASLRATSTLLLAAQLLSLGHLLIVRHTICPEHGEAIHSGARSETQALPPTHERATSDPALDVGAAPAEHAHDHCLAQANTRERFALLPSADLTTGPLLLAPLRPSLAAVALTPAVSVLLLAPKNSPPWA
ncbi:MAG TPA: hypothetical protein VJ860_22650 [Polyangia bacterium]|nr:hypothetical protein [Polyangia bacterium]